MNKKLLVSVLFFLFIFSSVTLVKGAQKIEHLVWAWGGRSGCAYEFYPNDYTEEEDFKSDPFMTFHVPASKNYYALFFQTWATAQVSWKQNSPGPVQDRKVRAFVYLRIISPLISNDIEVLGGGSVIATAEARADGIYDSKGLRETCYRKFILRRDNVDFWYVWDTVSEQYIYDDGIIIPILNSLIDNGFDVEVYTEGSIQGASRFVLFPWVTIEVTRLWKN